MEDIKKRKIEFYKFYKKNLPRALNFIKNEDKGEFKDDYKGKNVEHIVLDFETKGDIKNEKIKKYLDNLIKNDSPKILYSEFVDQDKFMFFNKTLNYKKSFFIINESKKITFTNSFKPSTLDMHREMSKGIELIEDTKLIKKVGDLDKFKYEESKTDVKTYFENITDKIMEMIGIDKSNLNVNSEAKKKLNSLLKDNGEAEISELCKDRDIEKFLNKVSITNFINQSFTGEILSLIGMFIEGRNEYHNILCNPGTKILRDIKFYDPQKKIFSFLIDYDPLLKDCMLSDNKPAKFDGSLMVMMFRKYPTETFCKYQQLFFLELDMPLEAIPILKIKGELINEKKVNIIDCSKNKKQENVQKNIEKLKDDFKIKFGQRGFYSCENGTKITRQIFYGIEKIKSLCIIILSEETFDLIKAQYFSELERETNLFKLYYEGTNSSTPENWKYSSCLIGKNNVKKLETCLKSAMSREKQKKLDSSLLYHESKYYFIKADRKNMINISKNLDIITEDLKDNVPFDNFEIITDGFDDDSVFMSLAYFYMFNRSRDVSEGMMYYFLKYLSKYAEDMTVISAKNMFNSGFSFSGQFEFYNKIFDKIKNHSKTNKDEIKVHSDWSKLADKILNILES